MRPSDNLAQDVELAWVAFGNDISYRAASAPRLPRNRSGRAATTAKGSKYASLKACAFAMLSLGHAGVATC